MVEKPDVDPDVVKELSIHLTDEHERFVFELFFRAQGLLEDSNFPNTIVTFEMLQSAFSAFEAGYTHDEISAAYPVAAWRADTVEVPRAWLRELVTGWQKYKSSPPGATIGEAFNLEGGGQGALPARSQIENYNRKIRLSNAVLKEYLDERLNGGRGSWERAGGIVARAENVSEDTVKRASREVRKRTLASLEKIQAIGGKTSRSDAPEAEE